MTDQINRIGDKPTLWIAAVMAAVGILMLAQPDGIVAAWIDAVGVDSNSSIGIRLGGLFKIGAIILVLVGSRRTYQALKKP